MEPLQITVRKLFEYRDRTISMLAIDGRDFCFVLEDGYKEVKVPGETRIPAGKYAIVPRYLGEFFKKYQKNYGHKCSLQIDKVPGFEFILLHIGNYPRDTRGCLLVGNGVLFDGGSVVLSNSTVAYTALYNKIIPHFDAGAPVWIEITR